jgi:restriction endonuclease S subunit
MSDLPEGWASCKIGEVTNIVSGGTPPSRDPSNFKVEEGVAWIRPSDLSNYKNIYISRGDRNLSEKGFEGCSATKIPTGSVLFSSRAPVGYVAIALNEVTTNQGFKSFILPKELDSRFVYFYLRHIKQIAEAMATGTTFKELSTSVAAQLPLVIAPFAEQKRIADKIEALLDQVAACRDRLDRVSLIIKRFRQAVLTAATSGQLTNEGDETTIICLSQVIEQLKTGPFGSALHRSDYVLNGIPVINPMHINAGSITPTSEMTVSAEKAEKLQEYLLREGDIILARRGVMGRCAVVGIKEQGWLCGSGSMIIRTTNRILPEYLQIVLSSREIVEVLEANAVGSTMVNLNQRILLDLKIPVPSISIQGLITHQVSALFSYANRIETLHLNACDRIERLIPELLDKAFRGELVPQDPTDEPASILLERIQAEKIRMESEQKTTRTVRRSNKENAKIPMKKSSDYLEALRSTFKTLDNPTDARQLFDRAGFKPEETVQFYEALREIPEIRTVFERSEPIQPPQSSSETVEDKQSSEKGRFRLIELWLEDFKNLSDYTVRFDPAHSIDVVLGWNGTGKSNLFEALVIIFRDLHRWWEKNQWTQKPMKGYRLRYAIDSEIVEVVWQPSDGKMKRPKLKAGKLLEGNKQPEELKNINREKLLLPRFIFGYYSGPTNRLAEHFLPMKQDHYDRLLKANSDDPATLNHLLEQRRFFCAENHHAKYVLLAFCHKEDEKINQFLEERLRIIGFESALFIIRKPRWAKKGQTAENFWGATGIMRRVMERLRQFAIAPMVIEQTVPDGFRSRKEEHYYFFLPDLQSLHAFAAEYQDARTFFLALESTDFSELIYDLKIQVRVKATETEQVGIAFHELSEGEQQLLMVLGLMRFTKSNQSLVLLDEPDTHLNPHWSVDYLKLLARLMSEDASESEEQQTSQILMSTHDPLVIASLFKEQIHLLKRDWQTGICKWGQPSIDPRGLGFTGILTSEMFGMRSDLDEETLADLDSKVRIIAKEGSLTPAENLELEKINQRLEDAGFQKAFSDPYYAAFIRAWSRRHSDLMAGIQFVNPEKQAEIDRIAREVLEESIAELQAEAMN